MFPFKLITWNVRTLLDIDENRPHRRAMLIAEELRHYKVDIAALSETRLLGEGALKEEERLPPLVSKISMVWDW